MTSMTAVILMLLGQMFQCPDSPSFVQSAAQAAAAEFGVRLEVRPTIRNVPE